MRVQVHMCVYLGHFEAARSNHLHQTLERVYFYVSFPDPPCLDISGNETHPRKLRSEVVPTGTYIR